MASQRAYARAAKCGKAACAHTTYCNFHWSLYFQRPHQPFLSEGKQRCIQNAAVDQPQVPQWQDWWQIFITSQWLCPGTQPKFHHSQTRPSLLHRDTHQRATHAAKTIQRRGTIHQRHTLEWCKRVHHSYSARSDAVHRPSSMLVNERCEAK